MSDDPDALPGPGTALVGYGRPPVKSRFQPGKSGNPKGRPRKPRPAKVNLGFGLEPTSDLVLVEAYRLVSVREGEKVIELPAIQAVLRSMGVSAMKGNRFAQKALTEIVQKTESQHKAMKDSLFESMCDYKWRWEPEFRRCEAQGLPPPDILPHPDDIIIDWNTGYANIRGARTPEEKKRWDEILEFRDELIEEIAFMQKQNRRRGTPPHMLNLVESWQANVDRLNSGLPKRYRKGSGRKVLEAD